MCSQPTRSATWTVLTAVGCLEVGLVLQQLEKEEVRAIVPKEQSSNEGRTVAERRLLRGQAGEEETGADAGGSGAQAARALPGGARARSGKAAPPTAKAPLAPPVPKAKATAAAKAKLAAAPKAKPAAAPPAPGAPKAKPAAAPPAAGAPKAKATAVPPAAGAAKAKATERPPAAKSAPAVAKAPPPAAAAPPNYQPGEYGAAQRVFAKAARERLKGTLSGVALTEAVRQEWMQSQERASRLAGMSESERKRRRFV